MDVKSVHPKLGEPVVQCYGVSKSFSLPGRDEDVVALRRADLHDSDSSTKAEVTEGKSRSETSTFPGVHRGEFVLIRGPSGGGKTTLLNILGAIDEPTTGHVEMFGERIDNSSTDKYLAHLRLSKIGFVFQTFNLLATMSAFENVELPMTILGKLSESDRKARAKHLLDKVGLRDRYGHLPSELSGGEQQRVTIARALANEPELLLLDEPTGDLDTRNTVDIMEIILDINRRHKTTCIMVTHNPDLECYGHRVLYVQDGGFVKQAINKVQSRLDFETYVRILQEDQDGKSPLTHNVEPKSSPKKNKVNSVSSESKQRKSTSRSQTTVPPRSSTSAKTEQGDEKTFDPDVAVDQDYDPDVLTMSAPAKKQTLPPLSTVATRATPTPEE